jgi:hypothetical protein
VSKINFAYINFSHYNKGKIMATKKHHHEEKHSKKHYEMHEGHAKHHKKEHSKTAMKAKVGKK